MLMMLGICIVKTFEKLFDSILQRYQKGLEESMKGSDFVSDYVESLNYIFHKVDLKRGGSYIETPEWIKKMQQSILRTKMMIDVLNLLLQLH